MIRNQQFQRPNAPGMRWQYNTVNSQILGVLIERVTGKRYADYLSEKIWKPLGAQDAAMWLDRPGGNVRTFCCFFATPRDWARVGLLFQNGGTIGGKRLFPAAWLARMLTASQFEPDYGYQVWLGFSENGRRKRHRSEPLIARDMFWLDGHDIQRVYVIPSYQLVIVRIGEWSGGMWDDALIPNTLVRAIRPAGETP